MLSRRQLKIPAACPPGEWPLAAVVCDSDAAHLHNGRWPYYHMNDQNEAITAKGHYWTCSPLTYLRVLPAAKP